MTFSPRLPVLTLLAGLTLAACAGTDGTAGSPQTAGSTGQAETGQAETGQAETGQAETALEVVASFYPLEFVVSRVAGDRAEITTLTSPGVDPHDVELTPRTVGTLTDADLVVYAAGLQPAVDDAVGAQAPDSSFDVTPAADLLAIGETEEEHAGHADDTHDDHGDEDDASDGHDHGDTDPHFWLDPERYADVADAVAARLGEIDPDGAAAYRDNAEDLRADLMSLDEEFAAGLASCESRDVVTTHEAFGYLGQRYDLHLTGITGISPESEPSPARLAEVSASVRENGVRTIYAEPLLPAGIAETVARETGAEVLALDPVEGITEASAGEDYLEVMRSNLNTLRDGQRCS